VHSRAESNSFTTRMGGSISIVCGDEYIKGMGGSSGMEFEIVHSGFWGSVPLSYVAYCYGANDAAIGWKQNVSDFGSVLRKKVSMKVPGNYLKVGQSYKLKLFTSDSLFASTVCVKSFRCTDFNTVITEKLATQSEMHAAQTQAVVNSMAVKAARSDTKSNAEIERLRRENMELKTRLELIEEHKELLKEAMRHKFSQVEIKRQF